MCVQDIMRESASFASNVARCGQGVVSLWHSIVCDAARRWIHTEYACCVCVRDVGVV